MSDLKTALGYWKHYVENVEADRHPAVWAIHLDSDGKKLGAMASHAPSTIGNAALILATPYGLVTEIESTFVVIDMHHVLTVTHLCEEGKCTIDWRVSYGFDDHGHISFGVAKQRPNIYTTAELLIIAEQRLLFEQKLGFDVAFAHALRLGERLL